MTRVLALDLGTSSVRAQVYDGEAESCGGAGPRPYESKQGLADTVLLLDAARSVIEETLHEFGPVEAIGCSAFWHSLLALDERCLLYTSPSPRDS